MGGVILIFLLVVLVTILVLPAMRGRKGQSTPVEPDPAHEVVVHQLDDHRGKKNPSSDDAQKPQG